MGNAKSKKVIKKSKIKHYFQTIREAPEPIVVVDENDFCIEANDLFAKMLGLTSRLDLLNKQMDPNFSPDFQPQFNKSSREAAQQVIAKTLQSPDGTHDLFWLHKDTKGKDVWIHGYLTIINLKGKIAVQCVAKPIPNPLKHRLSDPPKVDPSLYRIDPEFVQQTSQDTQTKEEEERRNSLGLNLESESKSTTSSGEKSPNFLMALDFEEDNEMLFENKLSEIKTDATFSQNLESQISLIKKLNELHQIFKNEISTRNKIISNLIEKFNIQQQKSQNQIQELEKLWQNSFNIKEKKYSTNLIELFWEQKKINETICEIIGIDDLKN
ncbi:a-type inclusion protein [Anaeramoeba ignava]|uniref:A-type inclusion protein n=1 Tax=Anaeramoeba ignava TaxID=1746090 RepID=A0A9Q0LJP7_ANAIG|nr:a-type inclusion protein [Anaeramoeba ignava]